MENAKPLKKTLIECLEVNNMKVRIIKDYNSKGKEYKKDDILSCNESEAKLLLGLRLAIPYIEEAVEKPKKEVATKKRK